MKLAPAGLDLVARSYSPAIALLACALLIVAGPGQGHGSVAALVFASAVTLHALTFGAAAARRALPAPLLRGTLCVGALALVAAMAAPVSVWTLRAAESGGFLALASAASLFWQTLISRAPTLRDSEW